MDQKHGKRTKGRKIWSAWQDKEETRKDFSGVLIRQEQSCISELFKVIQDAVSLIFHCRTTLWFPSDFFECISHSRCAINSHKYSIGLMNFEKLVWQQEDAQTLKILEQIFTSSLILCQRQCDNSAWIVPSHQPHWICIQSSLCYQQWIDTWRSRFKQKTGMLFLPIDPWDKNHKDPDFFDFSAPCRAKYAHNAWKKHQGKKSVPGECVGVCLVPGECGCVCVFCSWGVCVCVCVLFGGEEVYVLFVCVFCSWCVCVLFVGEGGEEGGLFVCVCVEGVSVGVCALFLAGCVCVCVEGVSVCVCVFCSWRVWVCVCSWRNVCVCVLLFLAESVCVCVFVPGRGVCVCVFCSWRRCVCVCVFLFLAEVCVCVLVPGEGGEEEGVCVFLGGRTGGEGRVRVFVPGEGRGVCGRVSSWDVWVCLFFFVFFFLVFFYLLVFLMNFSEYLLVFFSYFFWMFFLVCFSCFSCVCFFLGLIFFDFCFFLFFFFVKVCFLGGVLFLVFVCFFCFFRFFGGWGREVFFKKKKKVLFGWVLRFFFCVFFWGGCFFYG